MAIGPKSLPTKKILLEQPYNNYSLNREKLLQPNEEENFQQDGQQSPKSQLSRNQSEELRLFNISTLNQQQEEQENTNTSQFRILQTQSSPKTSIKKLIQEFVAHCFAGNQDKAMTIMELMLTTAWVFDGRIHENHGNNPYYRVLIQNTMFLCTASASNIISKKLSSSEVKYFKLIVNEMVKNIVLLSMSFADVFIKGNLAITGAQQTNTLVQDVLGISPAEMKSFAIDSYLFAATLPAMLLLTTYSMSFKKLQNDNKYANDSKFKSFLKFVTPLFFAGVSFAPSLYDKYLGSNRPVKFSGLTPEEMTLDPSIFWKMVGVSVHECTDVDANFPSGHSMMGAIFGTTMWVLSDFIKNHSTARGLLKAMGILAALYTGIMRILADCHTPSAVATGLAWGICIVNIAFDLLNYLYLFSKKDNYTDISGDAQEFFIDASDYNEQNQNIKNAKNQMSFNQY